jgi:hypothetical protein
MCDELRQSFAGSKSSTGCGTAGLPANRGCIVIQPETPDTEREFGAVLEVCFSQAPPTFIRTNDALHLASAKVAGEREFIGRI